MWTFKDKLYLEISKLSVTVIGFISKLIAQEEQEKLKLLQYPWRFLFLNATVFCQREKSICMYNVMKI